MMAGSAIIGALRAVLGADTAVFDKKMSGAADHLQKVAARMKRTGTAMSASITAPLAAAAAVAIHKFGIQEDAIASVAAVVKSTGGAAGFTTDALSKMAGQLQQVSTYGDEDILQKVTGNLLTFTQVAGPVFERAQMAVLDLSARMKTDLQQSAIMVGKALNDPILGLSALRRVGIQLSEQQQQQVRDFVKTGQVAKAQGVILDELSAQFGGQAGAIAQTMRGHLTQASNAWGDAMEKVGESIAPIVINVADAIKYASEAFQELSPRTVRFIAVVSGIAAATGPALIALGFMAAGIAAIGGPITVAVLAIGALTAAVVTFWPEIQKAAAVVTQAATEIYRSIKTWLNDKLEAVWNWIGSKIDWLKKKFWSLVDFFGGPELVEGVTAAASGVGKAVVDGLTSPLTYLSTIGSAVTNAWSDAGTETEAQSDVWAAQIASPMTKAAAKAAVASDGIARAAALAFQHQNKMFEQGKSLTESVRTPLEMYQDELNHITELYRVGAISGEAYSRAQKRAADAAGMSWGTASSSIAGSFSEMAGTFASHGSKMAKVAQIFGAAQALISTYTGAATALASGIFPANIAAAAAVVAKGLGFVAAIKGTSVPGFATGGSFKVGGAGGIDSKLVQFRATPGEMVDIRRPDQGGRKVEVVGVETISPDQFISGLNFRKFIERLNNAVSNGAGTIQIAPA